MIMTPPKNRTTRNTNDVNALQFDPLHRDLAFTSALLLAAALLLASVATWILFFTAEQERAYMLGLACTSTVCFTLLILPIVEIIRLHRLLSKK